MVIGKNLEAYFQAKDKAKIQAYREKLHAEKLSGEKEERKKQHWMHCPKCGAKMHPFHMEGIEIDKCPECLGIFFDNQELEQLLEIKFEKRRSIVHKIFNIK